ALWHLWNESWHDDPAKRPTVESPFNRLLAIAIPTINNLHIIMLLDVTCFTIFLIVKVTCSIQQFVFVSSLS
ncbi:MAG TPA: hypothetical protein VGO47_14205, partial [Chlamydiales bacterium]|nr:hypothetical protein [Chlamydiales bacterium]